MGILGSPNSSTSTPSLLVAIEAAPGSLDNIFSQCSNTKGMEIDRKIYLLLGR